MNLFASDDNDDDEDYMVDNNYDSDAKDSVNSDLEIAKIKVRHVSPEKREMIRKESEALLLKNQMVRAKTKQDIFEKRVQHDRLVAYARDKRDKRWKEKTKHSPFAVNLVAEDERISEENKMRTKEENERRARIEDGKLKAKNEIILRALTEFSDLDALRKEKRAIMDEEQRLKALLALEKVTVNGKADRLIAERAQRQRKDAKLAYRRMVYKDSLDQVLEEEREALMKKYALNSSISPTEVLDPRHINTKTGLPLSPAAIAALSIVK